jgi:outer membrane protein assembly factor BamB
MTGTLARSIIPTLALILIAVSSARAEDWPGFRGPTGQGISTETDLPTHWSATENLAWKTPIPGRGWSSPTVWGKRVFVTSTTQDGTSCHVICVDRDTGNLLWDVEVFKQTPTRKEGKNSYATPTPVTDGQRLYAFFSGGGAVALDLDGRIAWTNTSNSYYSQHGLGASPILYKDLLIMPFDWSSPTGEPRVGWQIPWDKSFVLALDKKTGDIRYKASRGQSRIGHVSPLIAQVDGSPQLVSGAGDVVEGFEPETGRRLWWVYNGGEAVVPSLVIGDGMVFSSSGFPTQFGKTPIYAAIRAWKLGGSGDVTQSNLVWEEKKGVPMIPSYLFTNHMLFTVKEDGMAQCFESATGKVLWRHRLEGTYSSSPITAGGKIYILSEAGSTTVIEAASQFKLIAENPLEGPCQASPAAADGRLFIRSQDSLFCIGKASSK